MGKEIVAVYSGDTVQKVCNEMGKYGHGIAVILNNIHEKKVMGVLSNKDVINKVISKKKSLENTRVSDIMVKKVISIRSDKLSSEAMILMIKHKIKRLVVIDNGVVQGILSSNDLLQGMAKYKKQMLDIAIDF